MSARDPPSLRRKGWGRALRRPESYAIEKRFQLSTKTVSRNASANGQKKVLKVKRYSSPEQFISELRGVNCHMGSHSVTFHPTQVNTPRHNPCQTGWYSINLPRRDRRLSWPRWVSTTETFYLSVDRQSPIQLVTEPGVEQLRWSKPTCYNYTTPSSEWLERVQRNCENQNMCGHGARGINSNMESDERTVRDWIERNHHHHHHLISKHMTIK